MKTGPLLWAAIVCLLFFFACEGDTIINLNNLAADGVGGTEMFVDEVIITPSSVETINGQRFQLKAQAYAGSAPIAADACIIWSSTAPHVANIETTSGSVAQVKAENPGDADIIARVGKAEGRCRIKVHPAN